MKKYLTLIAIAIVSLGCFTANAQNEFQAPADKNGFYKVLDCPTSPSYFKATAERNEEEGVFNVKWNDRRPNIFSSSGDDNKLLVWDLMQIGANIGRDDNEDAPSEMIFEHGGHTNKINDFDWNPNEDMLIASVDDDNCLQMWEMNIRSIMNK